MLHLSNKSISDGGVGSQLGWKCSKRLADRYGRMLGNDEIGSAPALEPVGSRRRLGRITRSEMLGSTWNSVRVGSLINYSFC